MRPYTCQGKMRTQTISLFGHRSALDRCLETLTTTIKQVRAQHSLPHSGIHLTHMYELTTNLNLCLPYLIYGLSVTALFGHLGAFVLASWLTHHAHLPSIAGEFQTSCLSQPRSTTLRCRLFSFPSFHPSSFSWQAYSVLPYCCVRLCSLCLCFACFLPC